MKILYLCADLGVPVLSDKGAAIHIRAMVAALRAEGHTVTVVAPHLMKSPWATPAAMPAPVVETPPGEHTVTTTMQLRAFAADIGASAAFAGLVRRALYNQELSSHLRRRFEHQAPDLIYERASLLTTAGVQFSIEHDIPHVLELNAPLAEEHRRYRDGGDLVGLAQAAEDWVLGHTRAVLAVSSALAAHVVARGTPRERVHVVPNGIDPALFRPGARDTTLRARLGLGDGPVVGFVGGLRPWHGADALPELAARLRQRVDGVRIVIVGDGPQRPALERQIASLGVSDAVRLIGGVPHDQVPDVIRQFDLAVAPYPDTPQLFYFSPLKLFEYLACGVPVVAPRLGQIAEVVEDGRHGALYRAGDVDALADACVHALSAPARLARMGREAAALVAERHTWAHNARRVTDLVGELTTASRMPS